MSSIAMDSVIVAIIAYIVSLSMALIFANKLKYEVDANQELLAQVRHTLRWIKEKGLFELPLH